MTSAGWNKSWTCLYDDRFLSHLFHRGVVKEDPLGGLGVEGEGTVVTAGVADHPHELQLSLFGVLICHPVEELHPYTNKYIRQLHINKICNGIWAGKWVMLIAHGIGYSICLWIRHCGNKLALIPLSVQIRTGSGQRDHSSISINSGLIHILKSCFLCTVWSLFSSSHTPEVFSSKQ